MEGMRLIATYVGPYGTTTCSQCRERLEPGERIFGDADTADIYCLRCTPRDSPKLLLPGECPHETTFLKVRPDGWACRDCGVAVPSQRDRQAGG